MSRLRDRHGDDALVVSAGQVYRLLGCFTISILPQFGNIPLWLLVLTGGLIAWRVALERHKSVPPPKRIKLLLVLGIFVGVYVDKGMLTGRDPGAALMVGLIAVKFLELRNRRDYIVLTFVLYFMALTALLFEQGLLVFVYVAVCCSCLIVNLMTLHNSGPDGSSTRGALRLGWRLLAQAMPLTLVLFLFYPRINARYGFNLGSVTTRLPDKLRAGSFESLIQDSSMAFRADFPDGQPPPAPLLYWRGFVLWNYNASTNEWLTTSPSQEPRDVTDAASNLAGGRRLLQRVTLRPHSQRWLFALDYPAGPAWNGQARLASGYVLGLNRELHRKIQYSVVSLIESRAQAMTPSMERASVRIASEGIHPKVRELAAELRGPGDTDEKVVANALNYFRKNSFEYTTRSQNYGEDPLYEFLFVRRRGFCEHFASSFTVLMRLAAVPARVVAGYHGGEYNPYGDFIVVRQLNAHAWSEVFIKDKGWMRVDPTTVATSAGLSAPAPANRQGEDRSGGLSVALDRTPMGSWLAPLARESRLRWQLVEEKWDQWVLSYTPELQVELLKHWRLERFSWQLFLLVTTLMLLLTVWLVMDSFHHHRTNEESLLAAYGEFCALLRSCGVDRHAWEGPKEYAERAARVVPQAAGPVCAFGRQYALLRYGKIAYLEGALGPLRDTLHKVREALTAAELKQ